MLPRCLWKTQDSRFMDWVMKLVCRRGRRKDQSANNPPNKQIPPPQNSQGRLEGVGGGTVATVGSTGDSTAATGCLVCVLLAGMMAGASRLVSAKGTAGCGARVSPSPRPPTDGRGRLSPLFSGRGGSASDVFINCVAMIGACAAAASPSLWRSSGNLSLGITGKSVLGGGRWAELVGSGWLR